MTRFIFLSTFVIFCLHGAGCSQMVTVSHKPESTNSALHASGDDIQYVLPTKVLIQPQLTANQPNKEHIGLIIAGPQNRWTVNLDEALPGAIQTAALKTYGSVKVGKTCDDCGLIFRPILKRIDIEKLSMRATVEIEVPIYDAYNSKITHISAIGKSPIMDVARLSTGVAGYFIPFFGTAVGKSIIVKTSRRALNKAIANFHEQIIEQTKSGALARHWLPSWENRGYEIGTHQYPAEQVAGENGCKVQRDEIRLIKQNYYAESFIANCWGKPSFVIDCAYGRCELNKKDQSLALQ